MSYSALFTSGLSLASQPRPEFEATSRPPQLQINVHPGTPRPRLRKRRSSLTIATSPISAVKSPLRTANDALRAALRSPREGSFFETLQNSATGPKAVRRKTVSSINSPPPLPAPTTPLPTLPPAHLEIPRTTLPPTAPTTPTDNARPLSPIISAWMRSNNPSRKSSTLLPPLARSRSSSASGRDPLAPSPFAANRANEASMVEEKPIWYDEDEVMKENESEAT